MKRLFVHCGLHKTGTTSVQNTALKNTDDLRAIRILYPKSGIPPLYSGHHNIAWEISRDRRFDPQFGDVNSLLGEIKDFEGNVMLTSEDFESSLLYPTRWRRFIGKVRQAGFQPVLVIYLRDPIEYLESLYLENLKYGFGEEFSAVVQRVCETGKLNLNEWEFCFAYPRIKASLSSLSGVQVIFRNYHALSGGSTVSDIADVIGIPRSLLREFRGKNQVNQRDPLATSLGFFLGNRNPQGPRWELRDASLGIVEKLCGGLPGRPVAPRDSRKMLSSFLKESFGFAEAENDSKLNSFESGVRAWQSVPAGNDELVGLNMVRMFSFETDVLVRKLAAATTTGAVKSTGKALAEYVSRQTILGRKWVRQDNGRAGKARTGNKIRREK